MREAGEDAGALAAPESVSKFGKMHFRRLDMHFSVAFPRFTSSKSASKRLELQADPVETGASIMP